MSGPKYFPLVSPFLKKGFLRMMLLVLLYVTLLPVLHAQLWTLEEVAPMPEAVSNNAVVEGFVNDTPFVYSFGGIDTSKTYAGIHLRSYRYHTMRDTWERLPDLPDTLGKIAMAASRVGEVIYIIGGYHVFANGSERSSDRVHRYHIPSNTFLADGAPLPVPIDDQVQAVWRDSLIYVVTGWSNTGNVANVQVYDPVSDQWKPGTSVSNNLTYSSFGASGVIVQDTIYYFGGAAMGTDFPIQKQLRKGAINPLSPGQITWSHQVLDPSLVGYRMAATAVGDFAHWLGGATVTYNYDGIAYNGSGGVPPSHQNLFFNVKTGGWNVDLSNTLPMDLRGIAATGPKTRYLAGGMQAGQKVSAKTLKLTYIDLFPNALDGLRETDAVPLFPNPVQGVLHIAPELLKLQPVTAVVFDIHGRIVRAYSLSGQSPQVDLTGIAPGTYFLRLADRTPIYKLLVVAP